MLIVSMIGQGQVKNLVQVAYVDMESPVIGIDAQFYSTVPSSYDESFDVEGLLLFERQTDEYGNYRPVDALVRVRTRVTRGRALGANGAATGSQCERGVWGRMYNRQKHALPPPLHRVVLNVQPTGQGVGGWVGGYEGKNKFVYSKRASHCWLCIQNFILPQRKMFLVWVGGVLPWVGGRDVLERPCTVG